MTTHHDGMVVQLRDEAARLRRKLSELKGDRAGSDWSTRPVDTGDLADQAADRDRREQSSIRITELTRRLEQIEAALKRIDDGSYGICEVCGGSISAERLEVLPHTTVCADDVTRGRGTAPHRVRHGAPDTTVDRRTRARR